MSAPTESTAPTAAKVFPELMKIEQAAEYLNLSVAVLKKDSSVGHLKIPTVRIGTKTARYKKSSLDKWIAQNEINSIK